MIKTLRIQNFKCFEDINFNLGNLTVLSGINGMGKSTILQAILMLSQSSDSIENQQLVTLNGKYQELGVGADILYENAEKDEIMIGYNTESDECNYFIRYSPDDERLKLLNSESRRPFSGTHIMYFSAERIVPRQLYRIADKSLLINREFDKQGEFIIQYLSEYGNIKNIDNTDIIINPGKLGNRSLANQTEEWMNLISPGVCPVISVNESARKSELKFKYKKGTDISGDYKSINVGFGITYVLPIIVTLLIAQVGDLIILENPEAHIHPKGQRILGEMIAAASRSGAQIIIETHSDHILNGIRLAVKRRIVSSDSISLSYFYMGSDDGKDEFSHHIKNLIIDDDGMLNEWPNGFFDEWDIALTELLMD